MNRTFKKYLSLVVAVLGAGLATAAACATGLPAEVVQLPMQLPDAALAGAPLGLAGLVVNRENVQTIFLNLKTIFNNAFGATTGDWEKIAMKVPSTGRSNDYSWLSNFPRMRKWIGEKTVKALEAFKYTIVNDDWEATIEVDRNDIEDDNLGIYAPQAQSAGESAKQLPDEIIADVVNGAMTNKCYDGQFFIDADHPGKDEDGKTISVSNKGKKKLTVSSLAAVLGSVGAGETAMMEFKDDEGRPLGIKPNILMVPPALKAIAQTLVTTDRLEDGKPNPYKGAFEVLVNLRLKSRTAWYLLDTTKAVKPFIYQERKSASFVSQTEMQSDNVFSRKKFKFGAEARGAGGYGFWQLIFGSDGTED